MLQQFHENLERHFKSLSELRRSFGFPTYAFEHNLEAHEVVALRNALCEDLARNRLNQEHWLLWTVIASEIGYTYDGDEYWDSFKEEIPPWSPSLQHREIVRDWFRDFTKKYNGFQPSGRWADHFSIISWPIAHSILPRYLQSFFARHLYDLRHELAANANGSVDQIGKILSDRYHGHSSRFEGLLQQTALTARLVLALRDEDVQSAVSPIYPATLARIVKDLEQKSSARGHLRDARSVLRHARLRADKTLAGVGSSGSQPKSSGAPIFAPGLKLVARKTSDDLWTIGIAMPDFAPLSEQSGIEPGELERSRFKFFDKPDYVMPGRALASYSKSIHWLASMPLSTADGIVEFNQPTAAVQRFASQLKIMSRDPWLLRAHADGVARQVLGNHVRSGEEYVVVTGTLISQEIKSEVALTEITCRTKGTFMYRFRCPTQLRPQFIRAIQQLGFGYALRANVKPVGVVPRWHEANLCSVWLSTEEILLSLTADFAVSEYGVSIDGGPVARLAPTNRSEALISLGMLPIGRHVVEVTAVSRDGRKDDADPLRKIAPEYFIIEVRAPLAWQTDKNANSGLRLVIEPPDASLADILEKRASLALLGPGDRVASIVARTFDAAGNAQDSDELGRVNLPTRESELVRVFDKLSKEPLSEKLQSSSRIDIAFSVDELGLIAASFPHAVAPFRWKFTTNQHGSRMRLIDEAGAASDISVMRYDVTRPDKRIPLKVEDCFEGITVEAPGALFVARHEGKAFAAFASVAPSGRITDFSTLMPQIVLTQPDESPKSIVRLLSHLRIWRLGRPVGSLAAIRKANVLEAIEHQIERICCGQNWSDKARKYREGELNLEVLQKEVGGSPGFASRMRTTEWTWHSDKQKARAEFFRLSKTYEVCSEKRLCDLALTLAFHPTRIRLADPKQGAIDFERLGKVTRLLRGAYFAKLASDLRYKPVSQDFRGS